MKILFILIGVVFCTTLIYSQNVTEAGKKAKNYVSSEYDRNAVTFIGIDYGEKHSNAVVSRFVKQKVPAKFYDNTIINNIIKTDAKRDSSFGVMLKISDKKIEQWLNDNKVGQQILSVWFNRQTDGSFNVDILKERGLFNANDNEFIVASASKRGESALMDMGMQLVNQSYVVAFDFYDIMKMNEYYDKNETPVEKRVLNGFQSSLNSYVFKLDFNDSVAAVFFQDYWTGENDPNKQAKVQAFENAKFPFISVSNHHTTLSSTQYNPGQSLAPKVQKPANELIDQLGTMAVESVVTAIEKKNQEFRVKSMVSAVNPISAKIGKKEGLKFDQRYFVLENKTKSNGDITSKRVAVIKSMSVVDNRNVTSGQTNPSTFYQIAGGKVDNYGMFLEQNNDVGLNVFLGTTVGGLPGFTGRAEYYISKVFGEFVKDGKSGKGLTSWKIYGEGGYDLKNDYEVGQIVDNFTFMRFSFGVAKDFYPVSFLHWGPFVGYGVESISWETEDVVSISSDFVEAGLRLGINLTHNIQLLGSATYYSLISSELVDSETNEKEDFEYKDIFEDRMGLGINVGLRIMF